MRSRLLSAWKRLGAFGVLCILSGVANGQNAFGPQGSEYPIAGQLRGEQVFPHISLGASGGFIVWQDNATDGDDAGISARRLDNNLNGVFGVFRVNEQGAAAQQNPKVSLLKNGGAVFVWQGGPQGSHDIFARFLTRNGTFLTGDIRVNTFTIEHQANPSVATLSNGDVIVVWSSYGQDGSMQGVFAQRFSELGQKIGAEFQVNQYASFNQRTPSVTGLSNGGFAVAWVSEHRRFENSVDIYARIFGASREAISNEFLVNASTNICANPVISGLAEGGFAVGWSQRDIGVLDNAWDVFVRFFSSDGPATQPVKVNTHVQGNHYAPQIASIGGNHLVVWTSDWQDGSREGIFGRFVGSDGIATSAEFKVNTYAGNRQIHPAVASDGVGQFVAVWSSFIGGSTTFDLFAQRYTAAAVIQPSAPFVSALSSTRLSVTWPPANSDKVVGYELYVDGAENPVAVTGNIHALGAFAPGSTHTVRLAYRFADGSRSPLSNITRATTWGSDENLDGLPDDWQAALWGHDASKWPDPRDDSDGDYATNLQEFLAGTNPTQASSVLRTSIVTTPQGNFLHWNTQAGFVYQVQTKSDLSAEWVDVGLPRFAAGTSDSLLVEGSDNPAYYRVKRLR